MASPRKRRAVKRAILKARKSAVVEEENTTVEKVKEVVKKAKRKGKKLLKKLLGKE
jgi:hypothetical protein